MSKTTDNIQTTCVLCCQDMKIFAIGDCDHPICFRCSTRMRVLSNQKYCAVCRTDLDKVVFVEKIHKFASIRYQKFHCDKKQKIFFQTPKIEIAYRKLLQFQCRMCKLQAPEENFDKLRDHMRRTHELYYCDLCVEHLQIFVGERKLYTRADLARHRRLGDPDDRSHKGHPLCEFCDERYLDNDELLKHLRREHYFCHFCDTEGSHQYYSDYSVLRDHFRDDHFLCEEGPCKDEQFTSAFKTEIDLKAHKAVRHAKKMSKAEARQARQIDLGFNYASRELRHHGRNARESVISGDDYQEVHRHHQDPAHLHSTRGRGRGRRREDIETEMAVQASLASGATANPPASNKKTEQEKRGKTNQEKQVSKKQKQSTENTASKKAKEVPKQEPVKVESGKDFPNLDGSKLQPAKTGDTTNVKKGSTSPSLANKVAEANHMSVQNGAMGTEDFPSLRTTGSAKPAVNSSWKKTLNKEEDFPPMSAPSSSSSKGSKKKAKKKKGDGNAAPSSGVRTPVEKDDEPVVDYTRVVSTLSSTSGSNESNVSSEPKIKRSTVIDTVSAEDFPSLSSIAFSLTNDTAKKAPQKAPPGLSSSGRKQPPPGFAQETRRPPEERSSRRSEQAPRKPPGFDNKQSIKNRVPPGFGTSVPVSTSAPATPQLTQVAVSTTALSNTENIAPATTESRPQSVSSNFVQPRDFQRRNQELIVSIREYLNNSMQKFEEFKTLSGQYRQGVTLAEQYYIKCQELLGKDNFNKIFPELVALLPDAPKQQELLTIHNDNKVKEKDARQHQKYPDVLKISNKGSKKSKGGGSNAWNSEISQCLTCPTCKQVVLSKDFNSHLSTHSLDKDFPSLSASVTMGAPDVDFPALSAPVRRNPPVARNNAWVKGK